MTHRDDAADERYYGYNSAFKPFQRYTVELHDTPWCEAARNAVQAASRTAATLGPDLTREQLDRIAYAAIWAIRDTIEVLAQMQQRALSEDTEEPCPNCRTSTEPGSPLHAAPCQYCPSDGHATCQHADTPTQP